MSEELRARLRDLVIEYGIDIEIAFTTQSEMNLWIPELESEAGPAIVTAGHGRALLENFRRAVFKTCASGRLDSVAAQSRLLRWRHLRGISPAAADAYVPCYATCRSKSPIASSMEGNSVAPLAGHVLFPNADPGAENALSEARKVLAAVLLEPGSPARSEAFQLWGSEPFGEFEIAPGLLSTALDGSGLQAIFAVQEIERPGAEGYPHQAFLKFHEGSGWQVHWILAQCASCFGVGTILTDICGTCGGSGWGFPDSAEFPYAPGRITAA